MTKKQKRSQRPKFIFVVGGVMSSVGKGTITASLGKILQSRGFAVTALKIDPYINVDAGTMNPVEHGEVFVTDDGDETDPDIGNYERFLSQSISAVNYMTTGRVYLSVIEKERNLNYGGKCVEVVPDIPLEVIRRIKKAQKVNNAEITMIEIGGTIGEYQNILFLEAARMMQLQHPRDVAIVMVSYLPIPAKVGEMKTKPTQYAARSLNAAGVQADFIVGRSEKPMDAPRRAKLALLCNLRDKEDSFSAPDVDSIYEVPLLLEEQGMTTKLLKRLGLPLRRKDMQDWKRLVRRIKSVKREVKIAVVGKYFGTGNFVLADVYISVIEALKHAGWANNCKPVLTWVDAQRYESHPDAVRELEDFDGIVVPGGFGERGVAGILTAIEYAREQRIPYFGLCYGMQLACVEIARNVCGLVKANAVEIDPQTPHPIIHINATQKANVEKQRFGGTLRLGAYDCDLQKQSRAAQAYKQDKISERHRHRYEFNNAYRDKLAEAGVVFSGINQEHDLVEIIELRDHPWFVGVQFHPEFLSRPLQPHPLFKDFIAATLRQAKK